ncbi:hypothetical protein HT031_002485 [Scenedesmus sp. PABB004]|nr:hypothetical protein HT031_002485 [Scenedesmus sp. PABB004]
MGLLGAAAQLAVVALILCGGTAYTRHHVASLRRADHSASVYMEDSKAGNGSRYRVLTRSADTGGESYSVEVLLRPTAPAFVDGLPGSTPGHSHAAQDEELEVLSGALGLLMAGTKGSTVLKAGDTAAIPRGTAHLLYNADNSSVVLYRLSHAPAGPLGEAFFESAAGLGWDYRSSDRVHPLQVLVLFDAAGTTLTDLPAFLQPLAKRVLVPLGRLLGFKSTYAPHRSAAAPAVEGDAAGQQARAGDGAAAAEEHEEL